MVSLPPFYLSFVSSLLIHYFCKAGKTCEFVSRSTASQVPTQTRKTVSFSKSSWRVLGVKKPQQRWAQSEKETWLRVEAAWAEREAGTGRQDVLVSRPERGAAYGLGTKGGWRLRSL